MFEIWTSEVPGWESLKRMSANHRRPGSSRPPSPQHSVFYLNPLWVNDLTVRYHLHQQHVLSQYTQVDGYKIHYFEALPAEIPRQTRPRNTHSS